MKRRHTTDPETSGSEVLEAGRVPVKAWMRGVPVEEQAREQLRNVASLPFVFKHVAVMPDVHWGMGATVGSVIATKGAIVPAAVGVDIGCGMVAARLPLSASHLPDNLAGVRSAIEAAVPHGRTDYGAAMTVGLGATRRPRCGKSWVMTDRCALGSFRSSISTTNCAAPRHAPPITSARLAPGITSSRSASTRPIASG